LGISLTTPKNYGKKRRRKKTKHNVVETPVVIWGSGKNVSFNLPKERGVTDGLASKIPEKRQGGKLPLTCSPRVQKRQAGRRV